MKILHFSDTHLWITLENTSRDDDFYCNFEKIIDEILVLKPDFVVHSWDLFHTSKPSNKAISIVVKSFLKLQKANIKFIIIAWNHDTPRLSFTTHPFEIFKNFENFYIFYDQNLTNLEFENINFIILPHINDENIFNQEFQKIDNFIKNYKKNVFISHFWLSAKDYEEYTDEISWVNLSVENLEKLKKMDYVALWHYHKNFCIGKKIFYAWSIEHTSFNQKNYKNWYNIITFEEKNILIDFVELKTRKMIDLWEFDCENIEKTQDLLNFLNQKINREELIWSICKISFINISSSLMLDFDQKMILDFFSWCFYFEFKKIKSISQKNNFSQINNSDNIIFDNFDNFFDNFNVEDKNIDKNLLKEDIKKSLKIIENI